MPDEAKRTFFYVPKANYAKLEREVERLSKRSQKAGGWAIELTRFGTIDGKDGKPDCYEVFLDAPDVRLEGYSFVAALDHSQETGNIIRMLPNTGIDALPAIYRDVAPKCDHCQVNRMRRDTFVLVNDADGTLVQLGSSCMSDFFKTDPRAIMKLAELVGYAREAATAAENTDFLKDGKATLRDLRFIPLEEFFLHAAKSMREEREHLKFGNGFVPSRGTNPTKRAAVNSWLMHTYGELRHAPEPFVAEDYALVEAAHQWIEKLVERRDAEKPISQFEHNLLVVGQASVIEQRATGIAAAIVGCAERGLREIEQKENPVVRKPEPKPEPVNITVGNMDGILALFNNTKLRSPRITIEFPETGEIVLTKAGPRAQYPGTINVCSTGGYDNATWYGRIHLDGRFERTRNARVNMPEGFEKALTLFAIDPAGVAAAYGHRSGRCCFCRLPLTDERSAAVGYGKTCAGNFHLPYPTLRELKAQKKAALEGLAA